MDELTEYFKEHPEEEDEFVNEMARLHANDEVIDYPEYWITKEWLDERTKEYANS